MDLIEFDRILRFGEGPSTEWKVTFPSQARDVAKTLAAFANGRGGTFILGVDDRGRIHEVADPDKDMRRLSGIARHCKPPLSPEIAPLTLGTVTVIYARVPSGGGVVLVDGQLWVRSGSETILASGDELRETVGRTFVQQKISDSTLLPSFAPPRVHGFCGRAIELARLRERLQSTDVSAIVVEGLSGVGKTALVAQLVASVSGQGYRAFWLDCRRDITFDRISLALMSFADVSEDSLLSRALENVGTSLDDRIDGIARALENRQILFILDDYHLITDPVIHRFVEAVAKRAVLPKILLISRERPQLTRSVSALRLVEEPVRNGLDKAACFAFLAARGLNVPEELLPPIWSLTGDDLLIND